MPVVCKRSESPQSGFIKCFLLQTRFVLKPQAPSAPRTSPASRTRVSAASARPGVVKILLTVPKKLDRFTEKDNSLAINDLALWYHGHKI